MVPYDWYRSFVAVCRAGTTSGAARARCLTQPAISQHIAALESAVGEPLFERKPRRMETTEAGKALYARVAPSVDSLDLTSQGLRGRATAPRCQLRIGAPSEYFAEILLPRLAPAPVDFTVRFGAADDLLAHLDAGELDVVVATQQVALRSLRYERLDEEEFVLIGARSEESYTLEGATELDRSNIATQLSARRWLSYGVELPIIRRFWQSAFGCRPEFQAALVIPNLHAIKSAVLLRCGVSVLPRYLCRAELQDGRLHSLLSLSVPVRNELWLAYSKSKSADNAVVQARRYLSLST